MKPVEDCVLYISLPAMAFLFLKTLNSPLYVNSLSISYQDQYVGSLVCINQERIDNGCVPFRATVTSLLHCAFLCSRDDSCVGVSVRQASMACYTHQAPCPSATSTTCDQMDDGFTHLVRTNWTTGCLNGGRWHFGLKRCLCHGGWVGHACGRLPRICDDLKEYGYPVGNYRTTLDVYQNGNTLVQVDCLITNSGKSKALVLSNDGEYDFNRTWQEYAAGFGDATRSNVWIGLDNLFHLHRIGNWIYRFRMYFTGYTPQKFKWTYYNVSNSGAAYNYAFDFQNSWRNADPDKAFQSCLQGERNAFFSSWDRDRDGDADYNCAALAGAGWWYPHCGLTCNPLAYRKLSHQSFAALNASFMDSHFNYLDIVMELL